MMKRILTSAAVLTMTASMALANGGFPGFGGKLQQGSKFDFSGNVNVVNEGMAYGDLTGGQSNSFKDLMGGGSATAPGGAHAYVDVYGGTSGSTWAKSFGRGGSEVGTMETGHISGDGSASTTTWKKYSW